MKTFILIALIIFIDGFQASEGCSDGYASDHKQAYLDVYGQNWHSVYNWKWCDMSCGALAAAGYCTLSWKSSLYCSNQDLKVQDTCKQSCGKCPTDCQWGEWQLIGQCSKTCGGGVQTQKRDKLVFEKNGGSCSVATPDQTESVACNAEPCLSHWVVGKTGQACNSVCSETGRTCNPGEMSKITSGALIIEAVKQAGLTCSRVSGHRSYAGSPIYRHGPKDCWYFTPGGGSAVCTKPNFPTNNAALCYCD